MAAAAPKAALDLDLVDYDEAEDTTQQEAGGATEADGKQKEIKK